MVARKLMMAIMAIAVFLLIAYVALSQYVSIAQK
jgi:hypothetical protein